MIQTTKLFYFIDIRTKNRTTRNHCWKNEKLTDLTRIIREHSDKIEMIESMKNELKVVVVELKRIQERGDKES